MLSKPGAGWCRIIIGSEFIGSASYLDWVPGLVIRACMNYLKAVKECGYDYCDHTEGGFGFNIEFDAEGHSFGLVEIGSRIYVYDDCGNDEPYIRLHKAVSDFGDNTIFVRNLLQEAVNDIEANFEDWVWWDAVNETEAAQSRESLNKLIEEAKNCLQ